MRFMRIGKNLHQLVICKHFIKNQRKDLMKMLNSRNVHTPALLNYKHSIQITVKPGSLSAMYHEKVNVI